MKKLVLLLVLGLSLSVNGQTKKTNLFYETFGTVFLSQEKIESENIKSVTTTLLFQDARYTAITNSKYIILNKKSNVELFITDLENALSYSKSGEKSMMEYGDKKLYKIDANGSNGRITLWSNNDEGLALLHPKKVAKLIEALKVIKDNYDK